MLASSYRCNLEESEMMALIRRAPGSNNVILVEDNIMYGIEEILTPVVANYKTGKTFWSVVQLEHKVELPIVIQ